MPSRKVSLVLLSLLLAAFAITSTSANVTGEKDVWKVREYFKKIEYTKLAGAENPVDYYNPTVESSRSLGFDEIRSESPGLTIGYTTYDIQSNCRMNRQVEWRSNQTLHFVWMKQLDNLDPGARGTGYEVWDAELGEMLFQGIGGGCDIHTRSLENRSGYVGLDVDSEGKAVIGNHHSDGEGWATTVWYDYEPTSCFFSPYRTKVPDSTMKYGISQSDIGYGDWRFLWPSLEYHIFEGDTVTHVFSQQSENKDPESSNIHYFRRVGSDTLGAWDYPPVIVDTTPVISQTVVSSRVSGKVVLIWQAPPGQYPGDPESLARDELDPGLGVNQRFNDIYYMVSTNMGASWSPKINMTAFDSTVGGWLGQGDMSVLIDTNDKLHVLWNAREVIPYPVGLGDYAHFWGSRLLHWDELNGAIRTVSDANWELPDSGCTGGAWNEMSICKPMLSECNGKFYAVFVQFNDIFHGIDNDCAEAMYSGGLSWDGAANGELYISVSDNGGYNWDIARNLTNTYSSHCDSVGEVVCQHDQYPSMPRFGMETTTGDFSSAIVVDPSGGGYTGNYYLDVFYVNDRFPGGAVQEGNWTMNPVKWFRVPCIDPIPNPVLSISPSSINQPTWTKPGVQLDTSITLENIGNAELHVSTIETVEITGEGWLGVGSAGPITISHLDPNSVDVDVYLNMGGVINTVPHVYDGYIIVSSDAVGGSVDSVFVELIIVDSLQPPETAVVSTTCLSLIYSNTGNMGNNGGNNGNGGANMNYFDDCDTTGNLSGMDDVATVYLYDASPFLAWVDGLDTIFNYAMYDADWLSTEGFRPLESPVHDPVSYADYEYGYSGVYLSKDSSIAMTSEYFAPKVSGSCDFVIVRQKFYNNSDVAAGQVFVGDIFDWDIPSDSGSENGSGYDATRKLMYMHGAEYDNDSIHNNDCVKADKRYGGVSYFGGYRLPYTGATDSFPNPKAMWTELNPEYVYPTNGFVGGQMYPLMVNNSGYYAWESTNPSMEDSLYQDLHLVTVFGQYNIGVNDTLVFVKILASEYNGAMNGFEDNIDAARAWVAARTDIFQWPAILTGRCCYGDPLSLDCADNTYTQCLALGGTWDPAKTCSEPCPVPIGRCCFGEPPSCAENTPAICTGLGGEWTADLNCTDDPCPTGCCDMPGDANNNGAVNILDVTFIISYLYKGGQAPPCLDEADANGNNMINILDVTYLIGYLYKGGNAPVCGTTGS
ncbi:MAG: hypothetical protein CVT49_13710 [candidate division Zixibacteria bacterium HGW-Zixibacteria-1]|nr:MAG: hypothetical protein CVT49_13710 [candidate division Zixibacteria bacterium HGW-Zixibacteria-1]